MTLYCSWVLSKSHSNYFASMKCLICKACLILTIRTIIEKFYCFKNGKYLVSFKKVILEGYITILIRYSGIYIIIIKLVWHEQ